MRVMICNERGDRYEFSHNGSSVKVVAISYGGKTGKKRTIPAKGNPLETLVNRVVLMAQSGKWKLNFVQVNDQSEESAASEMMRRFRENGIDCADAKIEVITPEADKAGAAAKEDEFKFEPLIVTPRMKSAEELPKRGEIIEGILKTIEKHLGSFNAPILDTRLSREVKPDKYEHPVSVVLLLIAGQKEGVFDLYDDEPKEVIGTDYLHRYNLIEGADAQMKACLADLGLLPVGVYLEMESESEAPAWF